MSEEHDQAALSRKSTKMAGDTHFGIERNKKAEFSPEALSTISFKGGPMLDRREVLIGAALATVSWAWLSRAHASSVYPLKMTRGGRLLLATQVNGHDVEALLDSAAEASFVDTEFARKIGLAGAETVTAKGSGEKNFAVPLAKGVTLSAAGLTLLDQTVAIGDLSDVGRRLLGHPLEMILGRELFDAARLRIDIGRSELEVLDDASTPRGIRLELKTVNGIEVFPVRVEGEETLAALDLGNGSNVLVGSKYAKRRGFLTDGRTVSQTAGGGLGGETKHNVIALKSLEIAGVSLPDVAASIDEGDSATDLNVGISVLKHFVITTDFRAHALWLDPRR
jgi:predicted aspartyl protease